ncbi:gp53-like domain-containing protein [Pseudomonas fluorescens]|uniref:gp53-like domain-containing protein n=1 Tax=Pseudomonas fluorescens TaxID=294 RepID=UPI00068ECBD5|nr:hypothetical protein [Pseudomonas fluorescens]
MADLPEANEWPEGIYQLETSDPVLGGPEGIDNLQAKQLANRTKWLKDQLGKIVDGVTTIGKAVKLATPRALSFKGAATGSGSFDGSADLEITLALPNSGVTAGTWPKVTVNAKGLVTGGASLALGDLPDGTTAPQFDNDKTLATTEFVQRAQGNFAGRVDIGALPATLSAAAAGHRIVLAASGTLTLPSVNSVPTGTNFFLFNTTPGVVNIARQGTDVISAMSVNSLNSVTLQSLSTILITAGNGQWVVEDGMSSLKYAPEFGSFWAGSGYYRLPSGAIEQWGVGVTDANGYVYVTFPIPFPNLVRNITPMHFGSSALMHAVMDTNYTPTGCRLRVQNAAGAASVGWQVFWRALGN